ncbi:MAG TPA: hypothetical protein VMT20_12720 [Terriglobia bacterium]|nr:hypothetical protein [Terriglobia bacterium]
MTGSRVFLGVLLVFALLYALGLAVGLRQNDSQPDPHNVSPPAWLDSLSGWLSPSLDLNTVQTVQGTCLQVAQKTFTLPERSSCTLHIPSSTQKYRKAKLHLVAGTSATLTYNSTTNDDPNLSKQQLSWPGKDPQSLVAQSAGGTLTLSCGSGATCQLQMQ